MLPEPVVAYCLSAAAAAVLLVLGLRNRKQGWRRRRVYLNELFPWAAWHELGLAPDENAARTAAPVPATAGEQLLALIGALGTCAHPGNAGTASPAAATAKQPVAAQL